MNTLRKFALRGRSGECSGFTLVELLVVIATVAVLSAVLLPALAGTRANGQAFQCQNNMRRLTLGWLMYQGDNNDKLMEYKRWVYGVMDWSSSFQNADTTYITATNTMATYIKSAEVYKCPADVYQSSANRGPRVRSVSLNGTLDGGTGAGPTKVNQNGRTYFEARKVYDLNTPGPAQIFVILDEHPDSINDGAFMLDAGLFPPQEYWRDFPASHHNGAGSLSFADGHTEIHRWMEQQNRPVKISTVLPVLYQNYATRTDSPWGKPILSYDKDYEWVNDRMPYRA